MQFVKYVQGLGWTQEQLVFVAFAGLVLVLAITLIRALKRAFTGRKEISRLMAELDELLERVSSLEAELDEKSEVDRAVERCLKALEAGWPQHDSEMAKAAMGMLLAQAATHPERNKGLWQALLTRTDALVSEVLAGSTSDPETTRVIGLRVQEMLTDALASKSEDPALRAAAERVFVGVLIRSEEALLLNPTAAMTTAMEAALKDMMQPWLDDEDDDDIKQAAIRVFMAVVKLVETRLSADPGELSKEFDSALIERVKELIGSDDDDIGELACKVVETRGSALLEDGASRFGEVDETIVSAVISHIEDNDFEEPVEKLARTVVDSRVVALTAELPEDLVSKVDEQVTGGVERWLEDNPDEVAPSVERLAKAVLGTETTALVATPPDDVVETVREKITDAVDEQLEELTEEISNAAREVAKAAIARSSQAS